MCREQSRFEKNDRNFPQRRRPKRIRKKVTKPPQLEQLTKKGDYAQRYPYAVTQMETAWARQTLSGTV
jgi:hypothetical protein